MLPRLRFVVASLVIAILPMVFLGAGMVPASHSTTPSELSRAELLRAGKPIVLGPAEYSEAQYRADRHTLAYARRNNELDKLRDLAVQPLAAWIAAPAGTPEEDGGAKAMVVRTEGPATVSIVTTPAENPPGISVDVTITPIEKTAPAETAVTPVPAQPAPAPTITDAPHANAAEPPAPTSGQVYAALNPPAREVVAVKTDIPPIRVILSKPKPRAKITRRAIIRHVAARPAPPVVQKPPFADFPLLAWLFNWPQQPQQPAAAAATLAKSTSH